MDRDNVLPDKESSYRREANYLNDDTKNILGVYTQDIDTTTTKQVIGFGNVWERMNTTLIEFQTLLIEKPVTLEILR